MVLFLFETKFETEVAHRHVVDCHRKFRQICVRYFRAHSIRLGLSYLRIVRRRNAATLIPIIFRHVRFSSNVMTDEWRSYRRLKRLNRFRHRAVNHGLHFVDPTDPAVHTQTIENKNGQLKDMICRRHGVVDQILPSLLKEFNWRERFGQRKMVFYNFWSQVAALYPCQR